MLPKWNSSTKSLTKLYSENLLTVCNCLMLKKRKSRLVEQLTMIIGHTYNKISKICLLSSPLHLNMLIISSSTYNYHMIPMLLQNPNCRMETSILFLFIDLLSIWLLTPRISKTLWILLPSTLATNKLILKDPMTFRILRVLVRQSGTSFPQFINQTGILLLLTRILTL